ncbi:multiple inositol polyphosphate phosphatase 1-like [Arctopsyche grandis]|uniref:multiple inositol polyphosphate phosphatase 1-like n=1 Tax=Arctopsyche grandis TaxID=121162 RepID=UPI00406D883F
MIVTKVSLIFLLFSIVKINGDYCLTNDDNPYLYFSTKTPYDQVRGSGGSETICEPIQMWILGRHGTRYASPDDLMEMKLSIELRDKLVENYESGQMPATGALCVGDFLALKYWTWDESLETQGNFLNEQGWKDLVALARRYRKRYPSLLEGPYTTDDYYFRHTFTQRTNQSCRAFIDGLFGDGSHTDVLIETPLEDDYVIQPYENCQRWQDEVNTNDDRKEEKKAFRKSDDYKKLLSDVTNRMGLSKLLKHDDIDSMYDNCRFDKTRYLNKISPWCSIFTKKELFFMEYYADLTRYYKSGYGYEINQKLGCMPLQHLMETFETTVNNNGSSIKPKLVAMFTHDTMLDMMFTTMNYAKDQKKLKGTDYEDLLINRRYRTSKNTPFAGNFVAVLHDCGNIEEKYQVQFFINERPMELPGCYRGICTWEHLKQYFSMVKDCNLDFCDS